MKATLERQEIYNITIDDVMFPNMVLIDTWETFKKFQDAGNGWIMILTSDKGPLEEEILRVIPATRNDKTEMTLVKASPDVIALIQEYKART